MEELRTDNERYAPAVTPTQDKSPQQSPVQDITEERQAAETDKVALEGEYTEALEEDKSENREIHGPLYTAARILSAIFSPFWTPFLGFVLLFFCTYLSIMPLPYKITVLSLVFCFTVLLPIIGIFCYQKVNGWGIKELGERKKRFIPYLFTIMSYIGGILTMYRIHIPRYMSGILLAALICMLICSLINTKWKISTHTASIGMMVGGLLSYSFLFQFNPINALYIFILLSGMLGSARIIVRQHTLNEVVGGFFIGLFCGIIGILFI